MAAGTPGQRSQVGSSGRYSARSCSSCRRALGRLRAAVSRDCKVTARSRRGDDHCCCRRARRCGAGALHDCRRSCSAEAYVSQRRPAHPGSESRPDSNGASAARSGRGCRRARSARGIRRANVELGCPVVACGTQQPGRDCACAARSWRRPQCECLCLRLASRSYVASRRRRAEAPSA